MVGNLASSISLPLLQAADGLPNIVKPWQQNWLQDAISIGFAGILIIGTWLWAKSGRSKRENQVPFERTAEDFAGTVQAGYGQLPAFLIAVYTGVLVAIALYVINSILSGVQY